MRAPPRLISLVTLASCAGTAGPPPPSEPAVSASVPSTTAPSAAPAPDRCGEFTAALAEGKQLADAGHLDRASKLLARASSDCAARSGEAAPVLLGLITELGRWDEATTLARAMLSAGGPEARAAAQQALDRIATLNRVFPDTDEAKADMRRLSAEGARAASAGDHARAKEKFLHAWLAWHPNGEALLGAGRAARALNQPVEMRRLLDRAIVDLEKATGGALRLDTRNGFGGRPTRARWGRDPRAVHVSHGPSVDVIDAATSRSMATMAVEDGWVSSFAASDDGRWIAAGSSLGGQIRVFDARSGQVAFDLEGRVEPLDALAFSPDGTLLVGGGDRKLYVWSISERKQTQAIEVRNRVVQVVFSRDGSSFAAAYGVTADLFDARALRSIAQVYVPLPPPDPLEHLRSPHEPRPPRSVSAIALSPDAKTLAVASHDGNVYVFAMPGGRMTATLTGCMRNGGVACGPAAFMPAAIDLAPDGRSIVAGGFNGALVRWNLPSKTQAWETFASSDVVDSVSFRPDGGAFVSAGKSGTVTFHEPTGAAKRTITTHVEPPAYVGFASATRLVTATASPATVRAWSLGGDTPGLRTIASSPAISAVGMAFDGSHETSAWTLYEGGVKVWKPFAPSVPVRTFAAHKKRSHASSIDALALSRDGAWIASAGDELRVWSAATGKDRIAPAAATGVRVLAFSPDGSHLGRVDERALTMIPLAGSAPPFTIDPPLPSSLAAIRDPERVKAFAFGPDLDAVLAVGYLRLQWGTVGVGKPYDAFVSLPQQSGEVAFSPDGKTIAATSERQLVLVDAVAARITHTIPPPIGDSLSRIVFSTDGRFVAAANAQGTHVFSVADGKWRLTLRAVSGRDAGYAFTPAGEVEVFGDAADFLACRIGPLAFPLDVCAHRLAVQGLAARALQARD